MHSNATALHYGDLTVLSEAHYNTLDILLARYIKTRVTVQGEKNPHVIRFPDTLQQFVTKSILFAMMSDVNHLQPPGLGIVTRINFMSGDKIGHFWPNQRAFANLSIADMQHILQNPCPCSRYPQLCKGEHVVTTDLSSFFSELKPFWDFGSNYRVHCVPVLGALVQECTTTISDFGKKVEKGSGMPRGTMSAWANTLARNLATTIRTQAAARVATDFVRIQGIEALLYTTTINNSLLHLHKMFVITVMDKNSSNLVLVCPKFYLQQVLIIKGHSLRRACLMQQVLTDLKSPLVLQPGPPPVPVHMVPMPPAHFTLSSITMSLPLRCGLPSWLCHLCASRWFVLPALPTTTLP